MFSLLLFPQVFIPIFTAIGFSGAAATAISGAVFMFGANYALSYMARLGNAQPALPSALPIAPNYQVSGRSTVAVRRVVYGSCRIPGVLTFTCGESQPSQEFIHEVWTLTGMNRAITGIDTTFADSGSPVWDDDGVTGNIDYLVPALTMARNALWKDQHMGDPADTSQPFPLLASVVNHGWQADTYFVAGQTIIDNNGNGQWAVKAGKSGGSEPTWSTSATTLTKDGQSDESMTGPGVLWEFIPGTPDGSWGSTDLQRGCAKVHFRYWASTFQGGWENIGAPAQTGISQLAQQKPNWGFQVRGPALYDPRLSPPAAVYSNNPALVLRDYLTDTYFGLGYSSSEIDDVSFGAAANVCDETVTIQHPTAKNPGPTEPRYTCDMHFTMDRKPTDVIKDILSSMCGELVFAGGKWRCFAGAWRGSSGTITQDMIHGPIKSLALGSKRDIHNAVKGTFVSLDFAWEKTEFPAYVSSSYLSTDGEPLWFDIELGCTHSHAMAQRIAKIALEESRRQRMYQLVCNLSAWQYIPSDTITVTHPRYFGGNPKTFKIIEMGLTQEMVDNAPCLRVSMTVKEHDSDIYNWDPATEEQALDITGPYILPTANAAALIASRVSPIEPDGTYHGKLPNTDYIAADGTGSPLTGGARGYLGLTSAGRLGRAYVDGSVAGMSGAAVVDSVTGVAPGATGHGPGVSYRTHGDQLSISVAAGVSHSVSSTDTAEVRLVVGFGGGEEVSSPLSVAAGVNSASGTLTVTLPAGYRGQVVGVQCRVTNNDTTYTASGSISMTPQYAAATGEWA